MILRQGGFGAFDETDVAGQGFTGREKISSRRRKLIRKETLLTLAILLV